MSSISAHGIQSLRVEAFYSLLAFHDFSLGGQKFVFVLEFLLLYLFASRSKLQSPDCLL